MHHLNSLFLLVCVSLCGLASAVTDPHFTPFSSSFSYPQPPLIASEFTANFMQQKYDTQLRNHITAGFTYFSPSAGKVRVDASPGFNDTLEVSIFDFANATNIVNTVVSFPQGAIRSQLTCSTFTDVVPGFPLFTPDILNSTQAAFIGIERDALHGPLDAWQFTFPPNVLVTAFVDANNTLLRYDFSAPGNALKTFVTTRFFNVVVGPVSHGVFQTDCA